MLQTILIMICSLPGANVGVAVLGDLLVGLLAGSGRGALNGLRDVVGGVLDGLHCRGSGVVLVLV